jgi:hypothetical protein
VTGDPFGVVSSDWIAGAGASRVVAILVSFCRDEATKWHTPVPATRQEWSVGTRRR